jgi:hypothetical protein
MLVISKQHSKLTHSKSIQHKCFIDLESVVYFRLAVLVIAVIYTVELYQLFHLLS